MSSRGTSRRSDAQHNSAPTLTPEQFDATETIAGFSLVSIKRALSHVGLMDDRDDIKSVSDSLHCPEQQALRVLEELEKRGYVEKSAKRKQWNTTRRGWSLVIEWHPPRRFQPALEREDKDRVTLECFDLVPCFLLRPTPDGEQVFEEAMLDVGINPTYDNERLIELNVMQPDDYDDPYGGALIETSAYVDIAGAKQLIADLQLAVAGATKELARRTAACERKAKRQKKRPAGKSPK